MQGLKVIYFSIHHELIGVITKTFTIKKINHSWISKSRWCFQIFFLFTPTWGNDPIWQIFFRWGETTNQIQPFIPIGKYTNPSHGILSVSITVSDVSGCFFGRLPPPQKKNLGLGLRYHKYLCRDSFLALDEMSLGTLFWWSSTPSTCRPPRNSRGPLWSGLIKIPLVSLNKAGY